MYICIYLHGNDSNRMYVNKGSENNNEVYTCVHYMYVFIFIYTCIHI
jgi:hypothetical protein